MNELGKGFDGTVEKAINSTEKLKNLPEILQKYMMLGNYKSGLITKIDGSKFGDSIDGENIQNYVAQISNLDKAQRNAIISVTKLDKESKAAIQDLIDLIQTGSRINGKVFEASLKSAGNSEINQGDINSLMNALGMKNGDNYALPDTNEVKKNLNMWAKAAENADAKTRLMNAGIIESTKNGYAMTDSFKKMIGIEEIDGVVKTGLTAKQLALNAVMQIGKQLALSFGVAIATWAISKAVDYIMNLKTRSEELVETMNESHDAAEQATKDVEEIQSKIDELNKSLKDAGVDKIEDIVDPAERERLQAINDMLEAQLELKKQISKDADDKANTDTSAVVNDKSENSIVKSSTQPQVSYDSNGNPITIFSPTPDKVTKTESLQEYTAALEDTTQKRRDLQVELDQIEASSGKDSKEYANKKKELDALTETFESQKTKVEELSTAVSEQMSNYKTDADSFAQYKDEYVAGTNAITAGTKALANANDDVGISTTAYDILLQKMQATKNLMDRRNKDTSNNNPYTGAVKTLKASGLETGDDIRELSAVPANQTKAQAEAIKVLENAAKDAGVTLDQFVSALETVGLVAVRNSNNVKSLSDAMTVLDNMQSAYQSCAQAVKEYNKTGYVTMDTLQSLCQLEPQYLNMLDLKNGKLKINTKTAQSLTQANIQLAKASILADTLNNIKDTNNLAKAEALLGDVTAVISDADTAIDAATEKSAQQAKDSDGWAGYDKVKRAGDIYKKNYHTLSGLLDNLGKQDPSKIWGKDDTSKSTKQATSAIDAWSTLSSAMDEYNKKGSVSLNTMKSLMGLESKYTAFLKKEGNQLTVNATEYRNLIQKELAAAAATADTSDKTKAKVSQYTKILKYLDENAKDGTISLNELRDAIEGVGASLDKAQEKTSGLKSAFGTIHDILNTDNPAGALTSDNVESVIDLIQEHSELKDILYDESGNLQINEESLKEATIALLENEKAATKNVAIQNLLQKSIDALSSGVIKITDYLKGLNTQLDDIKNKTDKFKSGFETINEIIDEYNTYGQLNYDSYEKLLYLDPQYLKCIEQVGNQLKFNTDAYQDLYTAELAAASVQYKGTAQGDMFSQMLKDVTGLDNIDKITEAADKYAKAKEHYNDVVNQYSDVQKYGNVDNFHRGVIEWNEENLAKYHEFAEQEDVHLGEYSTVLGESSSFWTGDGEGQGEKEIAYTPMLQTEDGVVPLTADEIYNYVNDVVEKAAQLEGGATAENILKVDANGLFENVAGDEINVHGMIAAVQGQVVNGAELVAADVRAIGGESAENIKKDLGETSKYAGKSMHDIQGAVTDAANEMNAAYDDVTNSTKDMEKASGNSATRMKLHFGGVKDVLDELKSTISSIKDLFSSLLGLVDDANDKKSNDLKIQGDAWIDVIDKRIDALNEENDAQERAIELAKLQDEYERAKANKTVHVYGGRGQGFVWKADENAVREAGKNLSDKQREYKKKDEIDKLEKLKDKVQETNNLIGTSWDDYQKKLKYTAEFEAMTFEQMEGHYDGFKGSVLNNMQAIQGATNVKNVITDISNLISTLETLANILNTLNGGAGNGGGVFGFINQIKNMFTDENGDFDLGGGFKKMFDGAAKVVSDGWNLIAGKNRKSFNDLISWNNAKLKIIGRDVSVGTRSIEGTSSNFFDRLLSATNGNLWDISGIFNSVSDAISGKTGNLFTDIIGFFTNGFSTANNVANGGLLNIVDTIGSMFGPIAAGAQSIGSAISSGVVSFFPSIFAGLGTLVTSVGSAMAAMMQAIAAALSSIPIAGWIAAAAAVAGAVALIATIASIASNVSSTQIDEPTPAFQAKKYAKGTRGVKKGQIANVDEKGEELIVRNPDQGRMTYLEKGDGVIPAKQTDNLMAIGEDPEGWLARGLAEVTGSAAAGAGMSAQGPNAQLSGAAAAAAAGVGSIFENEYDEILGDTNEFMSGLSDIFKKSDNPLIAVIQSMVYTITKTAYRMSTVGKINSSKTVTESTSNTKKAAQSQISSMTSNFESSWKSVAGELGLDTKDIEKTSKKMSEKMNELVNNTFDALNENTGLSAEQVEDVTNTMFDSLQKIYTSGWNSLASTSGDMSKEIADKLNASYKSSVDSTNKAMNEISKAFGHSWSKVGGGVKTLSTNVQKTMEQAWADTSQDTQKLMYDMRACFDNSWSMNEAGVTHLADMTEQTIGGAYDEITSDATNTFGDGGSLSTETDNAWANVEPGAKDINTNLTWMMDQSYNAIKAGCEAAVTSIKNDLATTGDAFEAVGKKAADTSAAISEASQKAQQSTQQNTGPSKGVTAAAGAGIGAAVGSFLGPLGAIGGAAIGGFFGSLFGHANGLKSAKFPHMANVDEQGPEMLVRQPQSGRYTYLETGDGVVPADITSRLFEMGGNPDAWFQKQMAKYGSQPIVQGGGGDVTTSIGDIIITNPVGSSDALANEIKQKLPTKVAQMQSKR